jgi:hypothetical protein
VDWVNPQKIRDLLEGCTLDPSLLPPREAGVYLVTEKAWDTSVNREDLWTALHEASPLYVGSGRNERLRTRVGELLTDVFGFYVRGLRARDNEGIETGTGHHPGGKLLNLWCWLQRKKPGDLLIAWAAAGDECVLCLEREIFWRLEDRLVNKNCPPDGCGCDVPYIRPRKKRIGPRKLGDEAVGGPFDPYQLRRGSLNPEQGTVDVLDAAPVCKGRVSVILPDELQGTRRVGVLVDYRPPASIPERGD